MKRVEKNTIIAIAVITINFVLIALASTVLKINALIPLINTFILTGLVFFVLVTSRKEIITKTSNIEKIINSVEKEALDFSKLSFIVYDDDFKVETESEIFQKNGEHIGDSIIAWIPELSALIEGDVDDVEIVLDEDKYLVKKALNKQVLYFKNITDEFDLREKINNSKVVFGLINFDNYNEVVDFDTENSGFTYSIKQEVIDYLKKTGIVYKQVKSDRMFLVLDEAIYEKVFNDRFSVVSNVRKLSKKADMPLTISMAFAKEVDDKVELDDRLSDLIDLAISRGGDQVVVKRGDQEVEYYGGSLEAYESKSKVKVRAIANSLKDLMINASNILIVGHENQDADCVSSSIMISKIAKRFCKDTAIVNKNLAMDSMIASVLEKYKEELNEDHEFISINEAANRLRDDTLVIMVDHHYVDNSGAKAIVEGAKKVAIIDHHRRRAELLKNTTLIYIEPSASSATELIIEFLPYLLKKGDLTKQEANIAYLGILIDTNNFKQRVGSRTFDALSKLKSFGADPVECDILNVSNLDDVLGQSKLVSRAELINDRYIIACGENGEIFNRTTLSKSSDVLAYAKNLDAAFTIANTNYDVVAVSARSNRKMNVQVIMERMGGGGHLTMAGVQKQNMTIEEVKTELINVVEDYYKELSNESNSIE